MLAMPGHMLWLVARMVTSAKATAPEHAPSQQLDQAVHASLLHLPVKALCDLRCADLRMPFLALCLPVQAL